MQFTQIESRFDLWKPIFLAFFCTSRPWSFILTLQNVMSWVQELFALENLSLSLYIFSNSASLAMPHGTGVHTAGSIHFYILATRVPF